MSLKKNVIANYIGQAWMALLSFIFFPLYIKYLGMESYGIISVFTFLQVSFNVILASISPVLSREMSRYLACARTKESTANLLRTMEYITFAICFIFFIVIYFTSDFLSSNWLNVENLPLSVVSESLKIGSLLVILRFIENIYCSSLIGLQKQIVLNVIQISGYSIKNIGVILALAYISPTIKCFCYWQILSYVIMAAAEAIYTYVNIPNTFKTAKFSISELKSTWKFSSQSFLNSFVAFLSQQSDKIILSKYLTLTEFGHYSLAVSVTNIIQSIQSPVSQAFYPHIITLRTEGKDNEARLKFHQCCQLISVFCSVSIFSLVFFSDNLLLLWTRDQLLTNNVSPIVKLLAVAMLISSATHFTTFLPYIAGKPIVNVIANSCGILSIIFITLPLIKNYGITGALYGNLVYTTVIFLFFPLLFNTYLKQEQSYWLKNDVIKIHFTNLLLFFILSILLSNIKNNLITVIILVLYSLISLYFNFILCKDLKVYINNFKSFSSNTKQD